MPIKILPIEIPFLLTLFDIHLVFITALLTIHPPRLQVRNSPQTQANYLMMPFLIKSTKPISWKLSDISVIEIEIYQPGADPILGSMFVPKLLVKLDYSSRSP